MGKNNKFPDDFEGDFFDFLSGLTGIEL